MYPFGFQNMGKYKDNLKSISSNRTLASRKQVLYTLIRTSFGAKHSEYVGAMPECSLSRSNRDHSVRREVF